MAKLCQGDILEAYKYIQNKCFPGQILDCKARLIYGKTKFNAQIAHWWDEYVSQNCVMCTFHGDYEPATLLHILYKCITAQGIIRYICKKNLPNRQIFCEMT